MKLLECTQGSPEWHAARAGVITASMFSEVRKRLKSGPSKGDYSAAAKDYAFRLAVERISGEALDDGFEAWQMRRGRELEEECRLRHEADIKCIVDLAGFVTTEDNKFGCSADSLINNDGGAEYKCFLAPEKLRAIVVDDDWGDIQDQVQGCLWLTGREWWDQCLYCPALRNAGKDFIRCRTVRDDNYIEQLEVDLLAFEKLVTEWEMKLRAERKAA